MRARSATLLSESHPVGRFKASFFVALGYSAEAWEVLEGDLRGHAKDNEALPTEASEFGQKYEVRGTIEGPVEKAALLVAVWLVLRGEDFPRLVTAYPGSKP